MKLYVASSWRNEHYEGVIGILRDADFEVWDWRNPPNGDPGFSWREIIPGWTEGPVPTAEYLEWLNHPAAIRGYGNDMQGLLQADVGVLLLPSGRSAHLEAGLMRGYHKPVYVIRPDTEGPGLMYKMFTGIVCNVFKLIEALKDRK